MMRIFTVLLLVMWVASPALMAQTPSDGFRMEKGQLCIALPYSFDSWTNYWEGALKRDNPNLGAVSRQTIQPMFALGVLKNVNLLASLPYVSTKTSDGTLLGHHGLQDISIWLKYQPLGLQLGGSSLKGFVTGGFSTPVSNYYPDYLPLSIGLGSTNLAAKGILHYTSGGGLYGTAFGGFTRRSNIELERSYYYTNEGFPTNEVAMPNFADYGVAAGFVNEHWKAEITLTAMNTLGGTDIRRNDAPFPSNNMEATMAGFSVQYRFPWVKGLGVLALGSYTLSGRNVGQSTAIGGGVLYQFNAWK